MRKRATILLATFVLAAGLVFQPYVEAAAAGIPPDPEAVATESEPSAEGSGDGAGESPGGTVAAAEDVGYDAGVEAGGGPDAAVTAPSSETGETASSQQEAADVMALLQAPIAQALRSVHNDVITSITAVLSSGEPLVGAVSWDQRFRLDVAFALPDSQVQEGDTTVIGLPAELEFYGTADFAISDASGNIVANAVIDGSAKTITLVYTSYPETHSDVTGEFHFLVRVDHSVVTSEQDVELVFEVGDSEIHSGTVHSGPPYAPSPPTVLVKSSWQDSGGNPRVFNHTINVNRMGAQINNAVLTDLKSQPGDVYNRDSLKIMKGTWVVGSTSWRLEGSTDVTDRYAVEWASDGLSFQIEFGDIAPDEGFSVTYTTEARYDPVPGERFRNDSTLTGTGTEEVTSGQTVTYYSAGGSAEGYVYSIRIMKQDADTGDALAGAVFNVIRMATGEVVGTATTGSDGTAAVTGLLKADYRIVEVTPPAGYEPLDADIDVSADEFGSDMTAVLTVDNHRETTSLQVAKYWVGPAADSVTVELTMPDPATGAYVPTGATLVLSEENDWRGAFQNLRKYDDNGQLIEYHVAEADLLGYSVSIDYGEPGAAITNTNTATVDIAGTKTWNDNGNQDGARPDSITVRLRAGGVEIDSRVVTADDDWSWTFAGLPKYDPSDGREVAYSVTEDAVDGYTAEISGDAERGFTVTNSHDPKEPTPPTTPTSPAPPAPPTTRVPKAGDAINPAPIAALAAASFGVLAFALHRGKRRERE